MIPFLGKIKTYAIAILGGIVAILFGWLQWAELAKYALMTYAAKEGVKYGAEAYKG